MGRPIMQNDAGIIGSAYERIGIWLLAVMKGSGSVAIYVSAYKFYDTVLLPAMAMASAAVAAVGTDLAGNARPVGRRLALRATAVAAPIALLSRRDYIARLTVAGLVGNVVANLVLVPTIGIKGAAVAFLITDVALLAAFYAALPKVGRLTPE